MYIQVIDGQVKGSPQPLPLTMRFFSEEQKRQAGWYKVENAGPSGFNEDTDAVASETFEIQSDKVVRRWEKRSKTAEEVAAHLGKFWDAIRDRRNQLLVDTDWVVLKAACQGTPVPTEWAAYRQALRDITSQADPRNIQWPNKPE